MQNTATFSLAREGVRIEVPAGELLHDNRDDEALCEWINSAGVGEQHKIGGAFAECTIERLV